MKTSVLISALVGLTAVMAGCHDENDTSRTEMALNAARQVSSSTAAATACVMPGAACDAEIDALTDSAFTNMAPYVPGLDMTQLETAITEAVNYAVGTNGDYSNIQFTYTAPGTSLGSSIVINPGLNADGYVSGGNTPVINDDQGIYADENAPVAAPDGDNGWYFKNSSAGDKVNWYLYADDGSASSHYTIADLRNLQTTVKHYVAGADYFFNIYTLRENDGDDAGSFYRSRVTLVSSDFGSVMADTTYTGEFNRDVAASGDLTFDVGGTTLFSTGASSIDDINDEQIFLIAFSTNSGAAVDSIELLLKSFTLGFTGGDVTLTPVAAHATSEAIFSQTLSTSPMYLEIQSGTDTFDGLVFKLTGGGSTFSVERVDTGPITLAQSVLLEKLDRGDGFNALVPEAVFDPDSARLVFDFGTALKLEDIASLNAIIYDDDTLMNVIGSISIGADGMATSFSL